MVQRYLLCIFCTALYTTSNSTMSTNLQEKIFLFYFNSFFSLIMCWQPFRSFRHLCQLDSYHDGQLSQDYIELYYSHCNPEISTAHQWYPGLLCHSNQSASRPARFNFAIETLSSSYFLCIKSTFSCEDDSFSKRMFWLWIFIFISMYSDLRFILILFLFFSTRASSWFFFSVISNFVTKWSEV